MFYVALFYQRMGNKKSRHAPAEIWEQFFLRSDYFLDLFRQGLPDLGKIAAVEF